MGGKKVKGDQGSWTGKILSGRDMKSQAEEKHISEMGTRKTRR